MRKRSGLRGDYWSPDHTVDGNYLSHRMSPQRKRMRQPSDGKTMREPSGGGTMSKPSGGKGAVNTPQRQQHKKKNGSLDALSFLHFIIAPQAQWILTPRTESIVNLRSPEPGKQLQVRIAWQGQ